jgi:hypothetical protein
MGLNDARRNYLEYVQKFSLIIANLFYKGARFFVFFEIIFEYLNETGN